MAVSGFGDGPAAPSGQPRSREAGTTARPRPGHRHRGVVRLGGAATPRGAQLDAVLPAGAQRDGPRQTVSSLPPSLLPSSPCLSPSPDLSPSLSAASIP